MNDTLDTLRDLLTTIEELGLPLGQVKKLLSQATEQGLCSPQTQSLLASGFWSDLTEAAAKGTLAKVDRTILRHVLGLTPLGISTLTPPEGTRLHRLTVSVQLDEQWEDAISAAGPNTPLDFNVWKVAEQYPPTGKGRVEHELVLLNYQQGGGSLDKALEWASQSGLRPTTPRDVFAVGSQYPNLHRDLGINPMYVVATTDCTFGGDRDACIVWWDDSLRKANLRHVSFFGASFGWFAFRK
jgi:hypothetical protein